MKSVASLIARAFTSGARTAVPSRLLRAVQPSDTKQGSGTESIAVHDRRGRFQGEQSASEMGS